MTVAACIATWRDGPALDNCLRSLAGHVDHVYTCDGPIEGIGDDGYVWPSLAAKRSALLDAARRDGHTWVLGIDADEELRDGHLLRGVLERWRFATFPIPFWSGQPPGDFTAPWKVYHVGYFAKHVAQSDIMETADGRVIGTAAFRTTEEDRAKAAARGPWPSLGHRPELRPDGRREIRYGPLEGLREPPPPGIIWVPWWDLPIKTGDDSMFYCANCGHSSDQPGVCTGTGDVGGHPETVMVEGVDQAPDVDPANGTQIVVDTGNAGNVNAADVTVSSGTASVTGTPNENP